MSKTNLFTNLLEASQLKCETDCQLLQDDLDHICDWAKKWQLCLNASKCKAFRISNKRKKIPFDYVVNSSPLSWKSTVNYLGVMFHSNLSWSEQCKFVSAKASKLLNFPRHSLYRVLLLKPSL